MSGGLLVKDGDVQIGRDPNEWGLHTAGTAIAPMLLRPGTTIWTENFSPWVEPEISSNEIARVGAYGAHSAADAGHTRKIEFTIWIKDTSAANIRATMLLLHKHMGMDRDPLYSEFQTLRFPAELSFMMWGKKYTCFGRWRAFSVARTDLTRRLIVPVKVRFETKGPYIYACDEHNFSLAVDTVQFSHPLSSPMNFGAHAAGATVPTIGGQGPPKWRMALNGPTSGTLYNPLVMNIDDNTCIGMGNSDTTPFEIDVGGFVMFLGFEQRIFWRLNLAGSQFSGGYTYTTLGSGWDALRVGARLVYAVNGTGGHFAIPTGCTGTVFWQEAYWLPE